LPETNDPKTWVDGPIGGTPLDAATLNAREADIEELDDRITTLQDLPNVKGDLLVATADNTLGRLAVGANGSVPVAASGQTTGLAWSPLLQVHAVGNSGTALTLDASSASGNVKTITLNGNCTFTLTGATSGLVATLELVLTQDGAGSRTVTWPASVKWSGGAPTLSTASGATDRVVLTSYNGGTTWLADLIGKGYA